MFTEREHFQFVTHKAELIDHKPTFKKETQRFTVTKIFQYMQLTPNKSHT